VKKVILSVLVATSLFAANTDSFQITPTLGKNFSDESSKMTNSDILYGLRGSWKSINGYGIESGFEGGSDVKYTNSKESTTLFRVFANVILTGDNAYNIAPYLLLGTGYEFLGTNLKGDPDQGFLDVGIGFNYQLTTYLNLSFEAKTLYKLDTEDIDYVSTFGCSLLFDEKFQLNAVGSPFEKKRVIHKALQTDYY